MKTQLIASRLTRAGRSWRQKRLRVLKSLTKSQSFLDSIDEALALQSKEKADGGKIS